MRNNPSHGALWSLTGLVVASALIAGLLSGCSSSQKQTRQTAVKMEDGVRVVEVLLDEYRIHMPTTLPPGQTRFDVRNIGGHTHAISFRGNGREMSSGRLKAGASEMMSMELSPGEYHVWCPVGPHSNLGMRLDLTVTSERK